MMHSKYFVNNSECGAELRDFYALYEINTYVCLLVTVEEYLNIVCMFLNTDTF